MVRQENFLEFSWKLVGIFLRKNKKIRNWKLERHCDVFKLTIPFDATPRSFSNRPHFFPLASQNKTFEIFYSIYIKIFHSKAFPPFYQWFKKLVKSLRLPSSLFILILTYHRLPFAATFALSSTVELLKGRKGDDRKARVIY